MDKQTCQICNKQYKRLSAHVKAHDITWRDYLKKYEPEKHEQEIIIDLLDDLYVTVRKDVLIQQRGGRWITFRTDSPNAKRTWILNRSDFKAHLEGRCALGVLFPNTVSKVLGLDIDFVNSPSKALMALRTIYHAITNYLPPNSLILSHSGNKGYHIDIFFAEPVPKKDLALFYQMILAETGYKDSEVEARGTGDQGYKLPLGFHQKTGNYCYLCDSDGKELQGLESDHLSNIKKADPKLLHTAIKDFKKKSIENEKLEREKEIILTEITPLRAYSDPTGAINYIEQNGITEAGTRHNTARKLAHLYKMAGYDLSQIYQKLLDWHKTLNKQFYKSTWQEIKRDCKELAHNAITYNGFDRVVKRPIITKQEILTALSIKGKPLRRLYYALLVHAKAYADKDSKVFYMTYKQIGEALGHSKDPDRGRLRSQLNRLQKAGLIEIVRANEIDRNALKQGEITKLPNQYRVINVDLNATNGYIVCDKQCPDGQCFVRACRWLLDDTEIKQNFTKNNRTEIYNADCTNQKQLQAQQQQVNAPEPAKEKLNIKPVILIDPKPTEPEKKVLAEKRKRDKPERDKLILDLNADRPPKEYKYKIIEKPKIPKREKIILDL